MGENNYQSNEKFKLYYSREVFMLLKSIDQLRTSWVLKCLHIQINKNLGMKMLREVSKPSRIGRKLSLIKFETIVEN